MAAIEKPLIKIQRIEICRNCQGAGYVEGTSHVLACYVCDGKGRVRVVKEIKIT